MKALLIGYGEIGKGMTEIFTNVHRVAIHDPYKGINQSAMRIADTGGDGIEILLIAIPWGDKFLMTVNDWQLILNKKVPTIIFSTVPVGTCDSLGASHFPIEAKHPYIARDVKHNSRCYFGGRDETAIRFLKEAGLNFIVLPDPKWTEFLKLRSTTYYGVCIEFARYSERCAKSIGLDYHIIKRYDEDYNSLVNNRGDSHNSRPVLDPPKDLIGGHCVVPNARILRTQFPSPFLDVIVNPFMPSDTIKFYQDGELVKELVNIGDDREVDDKSTSVGLSACLIKKD